MSEFDSRRAYAAKEEVYYDDGREVGLLHFVYSKPNIDELRGSPEKVLEAIDEYGRTKKYLMNVGEFKGLIVTKLIAEARPKVMVEVGGYVGYSAILFGNALRKASGERYICLERSPEFAAVVSSLVELAGLRSIVSVVVGDCNDSVRRLHSQGELTKIDILFLDHHKPYYVPDLKLCEELGLIRRGSILAADNVIDPGNPEYLEYVRQSAEAKRKALSKAVEQDGAGETAPGSRGDAKILYKSELFEGYAPNGVPVSITPWAAGPDCRNEVLTWARYTRMVLKSAIALKAEAVVS